MTTHSALHLRVLGVETTLRFRHETAAAQATRMFSALTTTPWRSPDAIIECNWATLSRAFVRSRIEDDHMPLEGIRLFTDEHPDGFIWNSIDPPFPPIDLFPFRDRFVRLHAGAVVDSRGQALLILGESGCGKSTLCRELVSKHGFSLLTDEDAFIHRRTRLIEPFAVGYAPWKDHSNTAGARQLFSPEHISVSAAAVEKILVLRPADVASPRPAAIDPKASLLALLNSQRPGGSPHPEVVATLTALARSVPTTEMSGGRYHELLAASSDVANLLERGYSRVPQEDLLR